jgi:hypothetical protein
METPGRTRNRRCKGDTIRRIVIIVGAIFSNFVSGILIWSDPPHLDSSVNVVYYESIK